MKEIKTLTGLRGLASIIVLVSHSANQGILPPALGHGFGQIGVMLFFVLSGFLMANLYLETDFNKKNLSKYCVARVARILPLYYGLITISFIIGLTISDYIFFPFIFNLEQLSLSTLFIKAPYVFWTIPVEIQFYFLFLIFWFFYKKTKPMVAFFAAGLICLAMVLTALTVFNTMPAILPSYIYSFYFGICLSQLNRKVTIHGAAKKILDWIGFPLLILLLVNLPELKELIQNTEKTIYMRTWGDLVSWTIVLSLTMAAINESESLSILRTRVCLFFGNISFGIYLIHQPVLYFFVNATEMLSLIKFLATCVVTIIISAISFYFFEKPVGAKIRSQKLLS